MAAPTKRVYDEIGVGYAATRQPDPRIAVQIERALGDAASVANVGAGAGSYEPRDRRVVAVELSGTMIRQRPTDAAPALQGEVEHLPLADGAVDAAMAILTVHHWSDPWRGFAEMRRVATQRRLVLTWDQAVVEDFWLVREYFPTIRDADRPRALAVADIAAALGGGHVEPVPVPHDCVDGFLGAYWRRPQAYLDPLVRAGISGFAAIPETDREAGVERLAADLESGRWESAYGELLHQETLDLGYRLVVA